MNIEVLVEKYARLIYKICYDMMKNPQDAEDLTQEVYINIYKNLKKYSNLEENEVKNLVCKIAINKCKDELKSKIHKMTMVTDSFENSLGSYAEENDIEHIIFEKERKKYINKMINELKSPYLELMADYYLEQLTLDEIATKYNSSKGTVKTQIHRAKKLLKEKMDKEREDYL